MSHLLRHLFMGLIFVQISASPLCAEIKIAILGDSLASGFGLDKRSAFPVQLELLLRTRGREACVVDASICGSTTLTGVQRLKWLMQNKPEIVILATGGYDGLRGQPIAAIRSNISAMIIYAQQHHAKVLLVGMKLPLNRNENYRQEFEDLFPSLAGQYNVPLVPFLLEGVAGQGSFNLADGLHPNKEGHRRIAETLYSHLEPLL